MPGPFEGVRVIEVAAWTFVPAAGAMLADMGAEVIKIEPPEGDPQRALQNLLNFGSDGVNPFLEIPNRGKRSVTLDLTSEAGRELLLRMAAQADVFLTSYLPAVRQKLRIDVADLQAANPSLIYVRGTGWGSHGPMANTGGYDLAAGWATSGLAYKLAPRDGSEPPFQPPAFFDLQGANTIAGAVGAALFQRERSGKAPVVDVSLMSVGMWALAPDIVGAPYGSNIPTPVRTAPGNPLANCYPTKDDRWLYLVCLQADRFWAELCELIDRPDLIKDDSFADAAVRFANREACVAELDKAFRSRTLDEWRTVLEGFSGVWAPAISFAELHDHAQIEPNGYLPTVTGHNGKDFRLVGVPVQFDEQPWVPQGPAPETGQDTEMVLVDMGIDWDEIDAYRERGAMGA